MIFSNVSEKNLKENPLNLIRIWENNSSIQAVEHQGIGLVQIVFHQAGQFQWKVHRICVDKPCVIQIRQINKKLLYLCVSDPRQKETGIGIHWQTPTYSMALPQEMYSGKTECKVLTNDINL